MTSIKLARGRILAREVGGFFFLIGVDGDGAEQICRGDGDFGALACRGEAQPDPLLFAGGTGTG